MSTTERIARYFATPEQELAQWDIDSHTYTLDGMLEALYETAEAIDRLVGSKMPGSISVSWQGGESASLSTIAPDSLRYIAAKIERTATFDAETGTIRRPASPPAGTPSLEGGIMQHGQAHCHKCDAWYHWRTHHVCPAGAPTENLANAQATQNGPPGKNILNDPQAVTFLRLSGSSSNDAFPEDRLETLAKDFEAVERFAGTSPSTWPVVLRQAITSNRAQAELVCALRTKLRQAGIPLDNLPES